MTTAVAWALIHSLWQAALLALILMSVRLATRSAQIRYAAGVAALSFMLGGFVTTFVLVLPQQTTLTHPTPVTVLPPVFFDAVTGAPVTTVPDWFSALTPYLTSFWLAGVCLGHLWQLAGMVSVWRVRRRGVWPAAHVWVRQLGHLRERLSVSRPVALLESVMVNAPVVIGHLRPVILVPAGLLANLPADQIQAVLLHELAHVRRCDYLVNVLQRWIEALFFYHPAVWWMSHVVRTERENCCDDIAVSASGDRHRYAQALAALEESRFSQSHPALAASAGPLAARIQRILHRHAGTGVRGAISSLTLLAATAMLAVAGWQQTPPAPPAPPKAPQRFLAQANPPADRRPAPPVQAIAAQEASPWRRWLDEDVVYIINNAERAAYNRLATDDERQMFIQQFWDRRGMMPNGRSVKEEHYRRISYANDRFAGTVAGWNTDRGRIYITLGPPAEIESHPSAQGDRPAYEIWRYRPVPGVSGSQSFTFADVANTGDYQLQTPSTTSARPIFNRLLRWTVTDPANRFVTGLEQEHFNVRLSELRERDKEVDLWPQS
jgi:GWxTD domain-containing protein